MSKVQVYRTIKMSRQYVVAMINADVSGLNEEEIEGISNFEMMMCEDIGGPWSINILNEETEFAKCEMSRLMSDCLEFEVIYFD